MEILQSLLSDLTEIKQEVNNLPRDTSLYWDSLVTQIVESLPAIQETQIWPLDQEGPLEKGMANHSSILAWRIPWTEEPGRLQPMGHKELYMTEGLMK